MSGPRRFSFGGVPVYNPQSLSKEEAIAQFHARQGVYQSLLDVLGDEQPSHVLIIGTRGMGKTTLLQRVRYGVEDSCQLRSRYVVLSFREEQYNVNRLHHFFLNVVDTLADAMEETGNQRMLARVEAYAAKINRLTGAEIEEDVPKFLAAITQELQRNLLLLVDNADRLFETIENPEQWRMRELLSNRRDLTFFGATTQASEGIYGPDRAFFEFFKILRLEPLSLEEVRTLLLQFGEAVEENEDQRGTAKRRVEEWLAADAARLRTLVQLTGGNPRTTVLLFHLVLDGLAGGAREYLEQLLDQCTPTYKGRVDDLPPQAQQVLDGLALHWDPATAMEIAEATGLETNVVSTYLTRLVRQGIAEKVDPGDSKKALYQVAERFFNIWYLMRASRRVRAKMRWFIEFLRVFFDSRELEEIVWERLDRFRGAHRADPSEVENIFAYAIASGKDRNRIEDYLRRECADRESEWRPYVESTRNSDRDDIANREQDALRNTGEQLDSEVGFGTALESLCKACAADPYHRKNWQRMGSVLNAHRELEANAESVFQQATDLDPKSAAASANLGRFLSFLVPERATQAETALRKAIDLDPRYVFAWASLGALLRRMPGRREDAESALRQAIEIDPKYVGAWASLGELLAAVPTRRGDAESAFRQAFEIDPSHAFAWAKLGNLLQRMPGRRDEAEAALRRAVEINPRYCSAWTSLGYILQWTPGRREEAEAAIRQAIEIDPKYHAAWEQLGDILRRIPSRREEAETALRRAIELYPLCASAWERLGDHLWRAPDRREDGEAAIRKAIELGPERASVWAILGARLADSPTRVDEAEAAFRRAIEVDPKNVWVWSRLGALLAKAPSRQDEAESALRQAIEINPKYAHAWSHLGAHLASEPARKAEAEAAFLQAINIDPKDVFAWAGFGGLLADSPSRQDEAEVAFRHAIEADPKYEFAWIGLGRLLGLVPTRREDAASAFRRAIEIRPTSVYAWVQLGQLLQLIPGRGEEADGALRKAIELQPKNAWACVELGNFLGKTPGRLHEAEAAFHKAMEIEPGSGLVLNAFGFFLACHARKPSRAEAALRKAVEIDPDDTGTLRNLGVLLFCETDKAEEGIQYIRRARQPNASDWISPVVVTAILAACIGGSGTTADLLPSFLIDSQKVSFWYELLELGRNYAPFGKILLRLCDLIAKTDSSNAMARLHRAVALAQLRDFPRAAVALEDALVGDPIELLSWGRKALEVFFAAAVESGRVRDCLEVIEKKEWIDAWRPIYEALKAVEAGSGNYLKRVAVEIREPAQIILRQIAPELPGLVIPNN